MISADFVRLIGWTGLSPQAIGHWQAHRILHRSSDREAIGALFETLDGGVHDHGWKDVYCIKDIYSDRTRKRQDENGTASQTKPL